MSMVECVMIEKSVYDSLLDLSNNRVNIDLSNNRFDNSNNKVRIFEVTITNNINDFKFVDIHVYNYNVDFEIVGPKCLKESMLKMLTDSDIEIISDMEFYCETQTYIREVRDDVRL